MMKQWTRRETLGTFLAGGALIATGGSFAWAGEDLATEEQLAYSMGLGVSPENLRRANALLARVPGTDLHCHPAHFFMNGIVNRDRALTPAMAQPGDMKKSVDDMLAGRLGVAFFSVVGDMVTLGMKPNGSPGAVRSFAKGDAWADYQRQLGAFRAALDGSPQLALILKPEDVPAAQKAGKIGALLTAEGGDFLEGDLSRVESVYKDGLRSLQLVHYRVNELGDIQTEAPVHNGLTPFGKAVVQDMNRLGIMVDVAHASYETAKAACAVSTKPVILSHSHLGKPEGGLTQRLLTNDHARAIAETGGIIGCWPAGVVQKTFADFVTETLRLVEVVGVEHVALGTDMDGNYKPVFDNYRQLPLLPAMLLESGLSEMEVEKIMGRNFERVFAEVTKV
ncbi:dipeptidase [Govanella unica]|uniref:Membrane dipeptidase n=1 Tax=Govanella unica TaxID=2975056 RepID=A0A9X3TZ37_9PROT|nr:membrane dipeptidase [Govania unica]MDA5194288.1 membrane dipeptidase [Govania unica]